MLLLVLLDFLYFSKNYRGLGTSKKQIFTSVVFTVNFRKKQKRLEKMGSKSVIIRQILILYSSNECK
jgi:hypothetical protein